MLDKIIIEILLFRFAATPTIESDFSNNFMFDIYNWDTDHNLPDLMSSKTNIIFWPAGAILVSLDMVGMLPLPNQTKKNNFQIVTDQSLSLLKFKFL